MTKSIPKIIFPEGCNDFIKEAAKMAAEQGICEPVLLDNSHPELVSGSSESGENSLIVAMKKLAAGEVDGAVAGIDYTTRDVILSARDFVGMRTDVKTFCSLFAIEFPENLPTEFADKTLVMADGGVVKNPTAEQLADIILLTADAAGVILKTEPRVACLSFSTYGSGGKDETIAKINEAITIVKGKNPNLKIDGEMQLDAAINPRVAVKKGSQSEVAGQANVLIAPDLNSGNILYKALEQFAGAHAYGPILLGFNKPISDLSRGSTTADVLGSIKIVAAQINKKEKND
ncbi:phosphate acetyltransferase [Candidatus Saccharibacteria bacterium]|nr:phosphate acetyltransferase [Candidatus Saccharibacteria bacterium]